MAAGLFLLFKETVIFWRGVSIDNALTLGANNFLYWSAIQWSKDNGYKIFDTLHNPTDTLRHYKLGFGCTEVDSYFLVKKKPWVSVMNRLKGCFRLN